jgi:O-antigen/teichoic acid export membrane protein
LKGINKRVIVFNSLCAVVTQVVQLSLVIWLQQYLVRRISPEEYSILPVVWSVMLLLPLTMGAINTAVSRFATEYYASDRQDEMGDLTTSALPIVTFLCAVVLLVGSAIAWRIDTVLNIPVGREAESRLMLLLMLGSYVVSIACVPFCSGISVRQKHYLYNGINLVSELFKLAILLVLLFCVSTRVLWLVVAQCAASLLDRGLVVYASMKLLPSLRPSWRLRRELVVKNLRFGGWVLLAQLGVTVYTAMGPILLNRYTFAAAVAAYHLGTMPFRQLRSLIDLVVWPLLPAMVTLYTKKQMGALERVFHRIGRYSLWILGLAGCPALFLGDVAFRLYLGPRAAIYNEAPTVMALVLIAWVPFYSVYGLRWLANAHARLGEYNLVFIGCQAANVFLAWFFLSRLGLGATGVGLASLLSIWIFYCFGFLPLTTRVFGIQIRGYLVDTLVRGLVPWLTCTGSLFLVHEYASTWLSLGLCVLFGYAVYAVTIGFCMKEGERRDIAQWVGGVANRVLRRGRVA